MIEDLKVLLGLPEEIDEELENKLLLILKATKQRLRFLLGGLEPPESLSWSENDFAGYMDDIRAYLDDQKESKKGKVRFL